MNTKSSMVDGFDDLLFVKERGDGFQLQLPCVLAVRNYDVFRVIKQLAVALDIRAKWWQVEDQGVFHYYTVLFKDRITGIEIISLVQGYEAASKSS